MTKLKYDLTGQTFGLLTALHHVQAGNWLVRCECGTEKVVMGQNLRVNGLRSCGCAYRGGRGRTNTPGQTGGENSSRWKVDGDVTYKVAHKRIRQARGPAREHPCQNCGGEAHSWAYRGGSDQELTQAAGPNHHFKPADGILRYSPDPADYDPLCWSCHSRKDLAEAPNRA